MIVIRKEQFDAFSRNQEKRFVDRLVAFLREQFPDAAEVPIQELRPGVEEQMRKAETYGLEMEQELAVYVTSAWLLGSDFDSRFQAAAEVLPSPNLSGEEKRAWLEEWTQEIFNRLEQG